MDIREASEIVKGAFGRRPDFPSGKDFVDEVRGHDIREGLKAELHKMVFVGDEFELDYDELIDRLLTYLKENGVVRKVEGELPILHALAFDNYPRNQVVDHIVHAQADMVRAGYTLTEEIEEGLDGNNEVP